MRYFILCALAFLAAQHASSQEYTKKNLKTHFEKYRVEGCAVLYNPVEDKYQQYNPERCNSGFLPASTFKIPNTLIALEEKVISDTSKVIPWNGHVWENKVWNSDQTLVTAMKYSCIWVYFDIATKVGTEKYQQYLEAFDYGNKDLTGPPNKFWLAGSLRISANQQIDFLQKFYNYELPVSRETIDLVKGLIVLEKTDSYTWSGKTGTGRLSEEGWVMWLVGYVEQESLTTFYAINFTTNDLQKNRGDIHKIARSILEESDILPLLPKPYSLLQTA